MTQLFDEYVSYVGGGGVPPLGGYFVMGPEHFRRLKLNNFYRWHTLYSDATFSTWFDAVGRETPICGNWGREQVVSLEFYGDIEHHVWEDDPFNGQQAFPSNSCTRLMSSGGVAWSPLTRRSPLRDD